MLLEGLPLLPPLTLIYLFLKVRSLNIRSALPPIRSSDSVSGTASEWLPLHLLWLDALCLLSVWWLSELICADSGWLVAAARVLLPLSPSASICLL
jgi:hypothetical protein